MRAPWTDDKNKITQLSEAWTLRSRSSWFRHRIASQWFIFSAFVLSVQCLNSGPASPNCNRSPVG